MPSASWETLALRAELLRKTRKFFDARGFLEVETPILSADTVVDRHLDPFIVPAPPPSAVPLPPSLYLQTSPEFAMKRLLAAGGSAIYQIGKVFRRDELGPLHNPEFTMVEWYRVGDGMAEGMQLLGELSEAILNRGPAEQISYRQAFEQHVGIDPLTADVAGLQAAADRLQITIPEGFGDDLDDWLDLLLVERVQPHLGVGRPVIVYDYPASQAALSRVRPENPPVAERFELYADGIELANGYHELTDSAELRRRNHRTNARRRAAGKPELPEQSRLLAAMDFGLPPCTGVALGFDRVVMLAAGLKTVAQVIAFPFDRA